MIAAREVTGRSEKVAALVMVLERAPVEARAQGEAQRGCNATEMSGA